MFISQQAHVHTDILRKPQPLIPFYCHYVYWLAELFKLIFKIFILFIFLYLYRYICTCLLLISQFSSVSSVTQSCPTLCDPMNRSTPGLPVHHQLPEFTQTHVHRVGDAIQPSHPLWSPSPAPNPSQHQTFFQEVNSSHEVAKVLEFQL